MTMEDEDLTAPFWAAAAEGRLVRPVCDACDRSFFTPQAFCPHCQSELWRYVPSDGAGVVYSHTVVHRAPDPRFTTPYVIAIVDLVNEGWSLMTNIVGVPGEQVRLGMAVSPSWYPWEGRMLPGFAPSRGPRA
jgi:uncharacterized OB-fold protein